MLVAAAGLHVGAPGTGGGGRKGQRGVATSATPSIRLRALFGLLDAGKPPVGGEALARHWAGPRGLAAAKRAADAIEQDIMHVSRESIMQDAEPGIGARTPMQGQARAHAATASAAVGSQVAVADLLVRVGVWWLHVGGSLEAATRVFGKFQLLCQCEPAPTHAHTRCSKHERERLRTRLFQRLLLQRRGGREAEW